MMKEIIVQNEAELSEIAVALSKKINSPNVITLNGTLGAGKTSFARSFIRGLLNNNKIEVPSPTFTLIQTYDSPGNVPIIHHFDLYRIETPEDVLEIGWEEAIYEGLSLIEWPEKAGSFLPKNRYELYISKTKENAESRELRFKTCGNLPVLSLV